MSGHSKWSTIKRRKGAKDAKRGQFFTKLIKELTVAARMGGGDPDGNPRLRRAIDEARNGNMKSENIDRAIKKGTGELEGVLYEELVYEGVGPSGTLVIVEVVTDNRNRTAAEMRKIFDKNGGQLGATGSSAWAFDHRGIIRLPGDTATEEQLFEVAVGAGAEDLALVDEQWVITTPREELDVVCSALNEAGIPVGESGLERIAKTPKEVGGADGRRAMSLLETLDDHDDAQKVYSDFEPSEALLAEFDG